jgi:hypothetical protein
MKTIARLTLSVFILTCISFAVEKKTYDTGTISEMNSVTCGTDQKSGNTFVGSLIGTDGSHTQQRDALCQEYTLRTERVIYKFRPRDEKHPALLPVGEVAHFRMKKDKLVLRVPGGDDHEREYTVTSMSQSPNVPAAGNVASK